MSESCEAPPTKKPRKEQNRIRNSGKLGDTERTKEVMKQHIWKDFPEDLFEAVIARLPIATIFRFRSVCQKWNTLLVSESFSQQHCAQVPRSIPWFYTITHSRNLENRNSAAIYDPCATKWHYPTISSLPTHHAIWPVASAGGLVCFVGNGHRNFYVCNPLTRSFKELPARSVKVWSRAAVGMTTYGDSASRRYMILRVEGNGEYEVYDSMNNSWTLPGNLPDNIKLPLGLKSLPLTVLIDCTLYFMRSDPDGIVSYDTSSGIWTQRVIPFPRDMSPHSLAECKGRLMLVGLLTENSATFVCIWELQTMILSWKEVGRMPDEWCLEFYGKHVWMTCLGHKGLLMLSLRAQQLHPLVTYDVSSGEWAKISRCAVPCGRKGRWIDIGTAFYPSLTAVA